MRTKLNLQDMLFDHVEELSAVNAFSRSRLYFAALEAYLAGIRSEQITTALNAVYDGSATTERSFLRAVARRLRGAEW
jgi:metal-responsive CopG/Arc/MetJ family transcriptional regulator